MSRVWLALAAILHGLVYFVLLPPWMGEDEPWHVEYARDLWLAPADPPDAPLDARERRQLTPSQHRARDRTHAGVDDVVRTQAEIVDSMRANHFWQRVDFAGWEHGATSLDDFVIDHTETNQPPLYYAVCAAGLDLFGIRDVDRQLWALRAFSFLCYLAVLACTYALARMVSDEECISVAAVLIVAWLPMHAHQAAIVSNDVLVKVFTAATLWLIGMTLLRRGGPVTAIAILACSGLALATKATAIGVAAPLCFVIAWVCARGTRVVTGLLAGLITAGALVGGAVFYWRLTGSHARAALDGMGVPASVADLRPHLEWVLSADFGREFVRTLVGTFNWYTRDLPVWMYITVMAAMVSGLLGSLVTASRDPTVLRRRIVALCWLAVSCQLLAMAIRGFAAGRFLFPVLPALGTLIAAGWIAPLPLSWRTKGTTVLAAALVLYDGFALWNGLFPNQYLAWGS